ncbi:hypothetical protein PCAR4_170014 [Paraburkholderia caribensis]|nr:hypothetical protein PCAR4_170014 [Paraburkholderia caribensis]
MTRQVLCSWDYVKSMRNVRTSGRAFVSLQKAVTIAQAPGFANFTAEGMWRGVPAVQKPGGARIPAVSAALYCRFRRPTHPPARLTVFPRPAYYRT